MAWMVDNSALALDQLGDPRQGPQACLVAECLGAALQSLFDLAQVGSVSARLNPSKSEHEVGWTGSIIPREARRAVEAAGGWGKLGKLA